MSIDTNIDYPYYHERDEQSFGYFFLGQKKINTETVTCRTMEYWLESSGKSYLPINDNFLNDILKRSSIKKVCLTVTEPICICVQFTDCSNRSSEFYKISFGSFILFQEKFCRSYDLDEDNYDWNKCGF